jgi:ureidoacrylate peracid hydrolase
MNVLRTLAEQADPRHTALLVIDVQNDFCHDGGGIARRGGDLRRVQEVVVPRLAALTRTAAAAGVFVVFARIVQSPQSNSEAWEALEPLDGDRLVVEGSWGAAYYPGLPLECADLELVKRRHSAFAATELDYALRARAIQSVVIGGVATQVCVEGTAREAADRDYYVTVLEDGTGSAFSHLHETSLENTRRYFGRVEACAAVASVWTARDAAVSEPQEILS